MKSEQRSNSILPLDAILIIFATTFAMRGLRVLVQKGWFPLHGIAALLPGGDTPVNVQFVAQIIQSGIMIGLTLFALYVVRGGNIAALGVKKPQPLRKWLPWALVTGLAVFFVMLMMTGMIGKLWPQLMKPQDVLMIVKECHTTWDRIALMLMVGLMAPIAEELLFRGYLYHSAAPVFGTVAAILLTSVVFGCIHSDVFRVLQLSLVGVFLNVVMLKGDSLWASVISHSIWNLVMLYFAFLV